MTALDLARSTVGCSRPTLAELRTIAAGASIVRRALVVSDEVAVSRRAAVALAVDGYAVVRGRFSEMAELAACHLPTVVLVDFTSLRADHAAGVLATLRGPCGRCCRIGIVREANAGVRAAARRCGVGWLVSLQASAADLLGVVAATRRDVVGRIQPTKERTFVGGDRDG